MSGTPMGNVAELAPDDKYPGIYLKSTVENASDEGTHYLLVVGAVAADDSGALTPDSDVVDVITDADALYYAGANSEGYRMLMRALDVGGVRVKYAAAAITGGAQAEATITVDVTATLTTTGSVTLRVGGRTVGPIGISLSDTPQTIANAIAAAINADLRMPVSAAVASGSGTTYVVTLTAGSDGARGNSFIVWKDLRLTPGEVTVTLAGGSSVTSGGVYFHNGAGTESVASLITTLQSEEYFTCAIAQRDATNLGRWETATNTKLGALVGLLENFVTATVGTLSAAGTLAQTNLNHSSFEMLWMEESETPGEELAAMWAAYRHQLEIQHPNQRYDLVVMNDVQPQQAKSKQPSRSTQVAALNYGLTPIGTKNNKAVLARAVTTRTQTELGGADNGTVDVATWRVALEYRRRLKAMLEEHLQIHQYVVDDPAPGNEPEIPSGTTYPSNIVTATLKLNFQLQNDSWLTSVGLPANRPRCALHPTSATPRPILYAPIVPLPLLHQIAGTVALRKFQATVAAAA